MTAKFKREDRYLVLKRKDLATLPLQMQGELDEFIGRANHWLPEHKYVVVENDWPEYETTFADIEARMTGGETQAQQIERLTAERDALTVRLQEVVNTFANEIDTFRAERDALKADAERYVAKRRQIFLQSMRMQISGPRLTEEEFNAAYNDSCDKAREGYIVDHRGVLVLDAAMKGT